jgi:hypothetical protein
MGKILKWIFIIIVGGILYTVTAVPVGLFIYSAKSDAGINIFSKTGYHAYAQCLREQAYKIRLDEKKKTGKTKTP